MFVRTASVCLLVIGLCTALAMASVNSKCPMTGNDVKPGITMQMHGQPIGFCCKGCLARFQKLSHSDQHVKLDELARKMAEERKAAEDQKSKGEAASFKEELILSRAYILPTCPVTDKPLTGDKVVTQVIDDREISFCCPSCIQKFQADLPKYNTKINDAIIKQQLPAYPLKNCLASGRPIDVKSTPTNMVYGNQLMRFCCGGCAAYVQRDPALLMKAMTKLDAGYTAKQMPGYKLDACVVSGEPLEDKTVNLVIGGQLVRLCCTGCEKKFNSSPRAYLAKLKPSGQTAKVED